jgi:hypothetical protein
MAPTRILPSRGFFFRYCHPDIAENLVRIDFSPIIYNVHAPRAQGALQSDRRSTVRVRWKRLAPIPVTVSFSAHYKNTAHYK